MQREPVIEQRAAQPYAGIRMQIRMDGFGAAADTTIPELFGWLEAQGISPAGPPFIRYYVIDMAAELDIEFGLPVLAGAQGDGRVLPGELPAGRYVSLRHIGPYDGLIASHAALQAWAREHGIAFDSWDTDRGQAWRCRVEHYPTDPAAEPDTAKWEVDIAYLASESSAGPE